LNLPGERLQPASAEILRGEARALIVLGKTSRYIGVTAQKASKTWVAVITHQRRLLKLGCWATEKEAAEAFDRGAKFLRRGNKTRLNFPRRALPPASPEELHREAERARRLRYGSEYRGVYYVADSETRPWHARIVVGPAGAARTGLLRLGSWETAEEAALAYDSAARFYIGASARLNFPDFASAAKDAATLRAEARGEIKSTR
jgi:hypothetical protein